MIARLLIGALFLVSFAALAGARNLVKKVYALSVQSTSLVLLFVIEGGRVGALAPIESADGGGGLFVDPLPQALMLTAIVVGICVVALSLVLAVRLHERYGTLDIEELGDAARRDEERHE